MNSDKLYWLGFSAFPGIGPLRFKLLLNYFGTARDAWEAPLAKLLEIGLGENLSRKFDDFRRKFSLTGYAQKVRDLGISPLILTDKKYPRLLKEIPDAPFLLYVRGRKKTARDPVWNIDKSLAVVGTRMITRYGKDVTQRLVSQLVSCGFTIVSGLAMGVDAVAHAAAIDSGGKTIAVLGCGVDCCNPRTNQYLYDRIMNGNGVILSEFPLSTRATKGLFPARNRIISGLSLGTVVTEGASDSGALITARFAAEQGREVFAVPGPITSVYSQGPTKLLKQGAKIVTTVSDILEELAVANNSIDTPHVVKKGDSEEEQQIIDLLQHESMEADAIIRALQWEAGKVLSLLSMMEIKGVVKSEGGVYLLI